MPYQFIPSNIIRSADMFAALAGSQPSAPAIEFCGETRSYAAVDLAATKLAAALVGAGLTSGDRVGILSMNRPEFIEALFGIQYAGMVSVPVNFRLAADEVAYVLGNCSARGLIVEQQYVPLIERVLDLLPELNRRAIFVLGGDELGTAYNWLQERDSPQFTRPQVALLDPATIYYTSGTTGFPKGATMSNLNVFARTSWWAWEFGLARGDSILVPGPLFHMGFSGFSLITLANGGCVALMREWDAPQALADIERFSVNWSFLVPKMISDMVETLRDSNARPDLSSVRHFLSSGSPLSKPLMDEAMSNFRDLRLSDGFGWTEVGFCSACRHHELLSRAKSVGRAACGSQLAILDEEGQPLRTGDVGTIHTITPFPFLGYYNNPQGTAGIYHGKWETGGDVGFLDDEGYLHLVDRKNDMIVSGGENVYPAEIERVLVMHPDIFEVTVVGVPDERWGESPRACVVLKPGAQVTEADIIGFCDGRLARYKHPRSVAIFDELPRNAMGKVLRRQIREQYWTGHEVRIR